MPIKNLEKRIEAFLAAQGLLVDDITKYVVEAKAKKIRIFDLYCLKEYQDLEERERKHKEKQISKLE